MKVIQVMHLLRVLRVMKVITRVRSSAPSYGWWWFNYVVVAKERDKGKA